MQLAREAGSWEKTNILAWVHKNMPKIRSHARKYLAYSPYEYDDFGQAAYEAALLAQNDRSHEFEQSFWFHFKKACLNMTYSKGDKSIVCFHEEYVEFGSDDRPPTNQQHFHPAIDDTPTCLLSHRQEEALIISTLAAMTAKEREVWELLLQGMSLKRIASIMGKSKTAVIKLKESAKKRVESFTKDVSEFYFEKK